MRQPLSATLAVSVLVLAGGIICLSAARRAHAAGPAPSDAAPKTADAGGFTPPPEGAFPAGPFGQMAKLGEDIFEHTDRYAPQYVGNHLTCGNCHIDAGRQAYSAPMWAAYINYPAYRSKNKHVNTFAERLQGCFHFSMNGKAPPLGDPVLVALESYAYWLSTGARIGDAMPGRGYLKVPDPGMKPDFARGARVFTERCSLCHGADGQGQSAAGQSVFPALWGPGSFNWGAGMGSVDNAAGFIKLYMPLGRGGTLSDQEAWDVALFMDSHERPQDPRFTGSIPETRKAFHDSPMSMYGQVVDGKLLGAGIGRSSVPLASSTSAASTAKSPQDPR